MELLKVGLPTVLGIAGIVGVLMAILGRSGKAAGVDFGQNPLSKRQRGASGGVGALLILIAAGLFLWLGLGEKQEATAEPSTTASPSATPSHTASPTATDSPRPSPAVSATPRVKVKVIRYIDNTGYIDLDGMKVYPGDEDEPQDEVDIAVNPKRWSSRNAAAIALSESGGKETCEQAIARETPDYISMGQVQDDKGFCAFSRGGHYAYVELLRLTSQDNDHILQVKLSVYP
jgi:hypothetical protein